MSNENWIHEKYISKKALPNENVISWIKWDPNLTPKSIVLKFEADVIITHVLNVSEEALRDEEQFKSGKISIDKDHIQIPGFFGFTCVYDAIPETERTINFIVEFEFDDGNKTIEYSTKIIRPILQFEESDYALTISPFTQNVTPLSIKLLNVGMGRPVNIKPFSEILETADMKIKIENITEKNKDESLVFVKTNKIHSPKIIMSGQGYGLLSFGYEYEDTMGNKYKSPLAGIAVNIEESQTVHVPITENLTKQQKIILQSTV